MLQDGQRRQAVRPFPLRLGHCASSDRADIGRRRRLLYFDGLDVGQLFVQHVRRTSERRPVFTGLFSVTVLIFQFKVPFVFRQLISLFPDYISIVGQIDARRAAFGIDRRIGHVVFLCSFRRRRLQRHRCLRQVQGRPFLFFFLLKIKNMGPVPFF